MIVQEFVAGSGDYSPVDGGLLVEFTPDMEEDRVILVIASGLWSAIDSTPPAASLNIKLNSSSGNTPTGLDGISAGGTFFHIRCQLSVLPAGVGAVWLSYPQHHSDEFVFIIYNDAPVRFEVSDSDSGSGLGSASADIDALDLLSPCRVFKVGVATAGASFPGYLLAESITGSTSNVATSDPDIHLLVNEGSVDGDYDTEDEVSSQGWSASAEGPITVRMGAVHFAISEYNPLGEIPDPLDPVAPDIVAGHLACVCGDTLIPSSIEIVSVTPEDVIPDLVPEEDRGNPFNWESSATVAYDNGSIYAVSWVPESGCL